MVWAFMKYAKQTGKLTDREQVCEPNPEQMTYKYFYTVNQVTLKKRQVKEKRQEETSTWSGQRNEKETEDSGGAFAFRLTN